MASAQRTAANAAQRAGSGLGRLGRAARALPPDRRLAAGAALGLLATLFLPWYQETGFAIGKRLLPASASLTGWHAFSWVEAAVLLVSVSVLTLLFLRAEGRAFHLPGGDGFVVILAGAWTCLLVIWRIFDNQGTTRENQVATTFGVKWGIFVALALAGQLTYAGTRIRAAHQPEPPLPGEEEDDADAPWPAREPAPREAGTRTREARRSKGRRRATWAEPVTWDEPPTVAEPMHAALDAAEPQEPAHE